MPSRFAAGAARGLFGAQEVGAMSVHNMRRERITQADVYIGRKGSSPGPICLGWTGYFGNPFYKGSREENVRDFEVYARKRLANDPEWRQNVANLHGKRLFCFCTPLACHGDVLVLLAEELQ